MQEQQRIQVGEALASEITDTQPVSGGCISEAFACQLADGRTVFVKLNEGCDARMFASEARGLQWLAEADALRVPEVLAVGRDFLVLEYIEPGPRAADFEERLGTGLATLHKFGAPEFGLGEDNFLATLEQDNRQGSRWPSFYVERRLRPLLRLAIDRGVAPRSWQVKFEKLFGRMHRLVGEEESAARLHGDLWSGNLHCDAAGLPVLIDPAVYGGHREVDLAMLRLFGSPSAAFFRAYERVWPLQEGHLERVALYQLYPLLAHVNLFGGSYTGQCLAALQSYL